MNLKTFLFSTLLLVSAAAYADDTFVFVDDEGNEIADGATIIVTSATSEDDGFGNLTVYLSSGISVKNTTDSTAGVGLLVTITQMDNGSMSCCFPGNCSAQTGVVTGVENGTDVMEAGEVRDFHTNYYPTTSGTCEALFQIQNYEVKGTTIPVVGDFVDLGRTITVQFVYDANSIHQITESAKVGLGQVCESAYNLSGQKVNENYKGIVIQNGKKVLK